MSKNIHIFIGNMGSGKSEISINFTQRLLKSSLKPVKLLDLDIIKPYIRIRDVKEKLYKIGIDLLLPEEKVINADMPIIPSRMIDYLLDDSFDLVMDIGGESRGVLSISQFRDYFVRNNTEIYMVINSLRPFMQNEDQIINTIKEFESYFDLKITYLVSNTHLRFESSLDQAIKGFEVLKVVSKKINVKIKFICVWEKLLRNSKEIIEIDNTEIFPINLFLLFPWENQQ